MVDPDLTTEAAAARFHDLFRAVYQRFHRRDERRSELSAVSLAVLNHLAWAGPMTVGEAAKHFDRAQSVMSDIINQLADKGLLERHRDDADRRRSLVWLTDAGQEARQRAHDVLSVDLLRDAFDGLPSADRAALLDGLRALLAADDDVGRRLTGPTHRKPGRRSLPTKAPPGEPVRSNPRDN